MDPIQQQLQSMATSVEELKRQNWDLAQQIHQQWKHLRHRQLKRETPSKARTSAIATIMIRARMITRHRNLAQAMGSKTMSWHYVTTYLSLLIQIV